MLPLTLIEIPFGEVPLMRLLDLPEPTPDYAGVGWAVCPEIWLLDRNDSRQVQRSLVVALHAADHARPYPTDVELEFVMGADDSVVSMLSAFLHRRACELPVAAATVLAVCNPHEADLSWLPKGWWWPTGEVRSWYDSSPESDRILLEADAWKLA